AASRRPSNNGDEQRGWKGVAGVFPNRQRAIAGLVTFQSSETVMLIRVGAVILALLTTAEPAWAAPPNKVPTVSLTAPMNGATFGAPATISISANASDSDGTISRVDLSGRNVTWHADGCPL